MVLEYRLCEGFFSNFAFALDFFISSIWYIWSTWANPALLILLIFVFWLLFSINKFILFCCFKCLLNSRVCSVIQLVLLIIRYTQVDEIPVSLHFGIDLQIFFVCFGCLGSGFHIFLIWGEEWKLSYNSFFINFSFRSILKRLECS